MSEINDMIDVLLANGYCQRDISRMYVDEIIEVYTNLKKEEE